MKNGVVAVLFLTVWTQSANAGCVCTTIDGKFVCKCDGKSTMHAPSDSGADLRLRGDSAWQSLGEDGESIRIWGKMDGGTVVLKFKNYGSRQVDVQYQVSCEALAAGQWESRASHYGASIRVNPNSETHGRWDCTAYSGMPYRNVGFELVDTRYR